LSQQRTLRVAVLGVPNAGKSTLVNALTGAKVSAVSPKTNTTATPCLGAFTSGKAQVLLLDTPGAVSAREARGPAHARRIKAAWTSSEGCDAALLVVDAARQALRPDRRVTALAAALASSARAAEAGDAAERARRELEKIREKNAAASELIAAAERTLAAAEAAVAAASALAQRASGGFGASPPPGWRPPRETILVLNKVDAISTAWGASHGGNRGREEALRRVGDSLVRAAATGKVDDDDDEEEEQGEAKEKWKDDELFWSDDDKEGGGGEQGNQKTPPQSPSLFFDAVHALSATRPASHAVQSLSADLASRAKPGKAWPLLPTDVSDRPARALAAEIVREKAFLRLRDELPYSVEVVERGWRERGAGDGRKSTRAVVRGGGGLGAGGHGQGQGQRRGGGLLSGDDHATTETCASATPPTTSQDASLIEFGHPGSIVAEYDLLVSREPVRRMVVGKGGSVIGEIGISARKELERLLDRKVHLYLTVRVAGRGGSRGGGDGGGGGGRR